MRHREYKIIKFVLMICTIMMCSCACSRLSRTNSSDNNITVNNDVYNYVKANYFKSKIASIDCYKKGIKTSVKPNTDKGKNIINLLINRFGNVGEPVLGDNTIKKHHNNIIKNEVCLVINFDKKMHSVCEGSTFNNFQNIKMDYDAMFFPLTGEYSNYFSFGPNFEATFSNLKSSDKILKYIKKHN